MGKIDDMLMLFDTKLLGYMLIQSAMFFVHYGLRYKMPLIIVFFPTILIVIIWIIEITAIALGVIISLLEERKK